MKLSDFDYQLPKGLIAQFPLKKREESRLLVVERKSGRIFHRRFRQLPGYLDSGDCLILNNTKVFPARLFGRRSSGGKVEILLLEKKDRAFFKCLVKPSRVKINEPIIFNGGSLKGKLVEKGRNVIHFTSNTDPSSLIRRLGQMPLPPYIKREAEESDRRTYQTVYASQEGAIAAPTAGLHFTKRLLKQVKDKGAQVGFLTLHVGWGTFKPINNEDILKHKMEEEEFALDKPTCDLANKARQRGGRVFAVGTTTARVLETAVRSKCDKLSPTSGKTGLFIYPGFKFKVVDALLTNFHLPKSTLFLLVCAFAGKDLIFKAYQEAIREKYRFYSYGDAMLIL